MDYVDIGNVEPTGDISEVSQYKFEDAPSRARRKVRDGDVIISTVRTYLKAIAPIKAPPDNLVVSTGFAVIRPVRERLDTSFCKYALRSNEFINEVISRSVGVSYPAINASDLANIEVYVPPISKQRRIADYLDRETAKIDALIAAKQRLLALLAEKRRSLITQAVTRGLSADTPLKDSGVKWFAKIPGTWTMVKLKYVGTIGNGSTPLRDQKSYWQNGSFPWLTSTVVNDSIVGAPTELITEQALEECHLPIIEPNSVLVAITGQGKTRGKTSLLTYQATINQHLAFITPVKTRLLPHFLQFSLTSAYETLRTISEGMGSTRGALTCEQLGEFEIPLPLISEQRNILLNLQDKIKRIDLLSSTTMDAVQLLQERRTSLISAAVTGQIQTVA